ncbi:hypothetical protein EC991_010896, partial [Linnemannia zychae]
MTATRSTRASTTTTTTTVAGNDLTSAGPPRLQRHVSFREENILPSRPPSPSSKPSAPVEEGLTKVASPSETVQEILTQVAPSSKTVEVALPPAWTSPVERPQGVSPDVTLLSAHADLPSFPGPPFPEDHSEPAALPSGISANPTPAMLGSHLAQLEIYWNETIAEQRTVTRMAYDYSLPRDRRDEHRNHLFYLQRLERSIRS